LSKEEKEIIFGASQSLFKKQIVVSVLVLVRFVFLPPLPETARGFFVMGVRVRF
jgi:hypothetical protein